MAIVKASLRSVLAAALLVSAWTGAGGAQDRTAEGDRREIDSTLAGSLAAGYREKNVEKVLSVYAPDATIVNYVWGAIDRDTLGRKTLEDFALLSAQQARIDVLEAVITGDEALLTINFAVTGVLGGAERVNRQDRYYLRMRRSAGAWAIVQQSYRPDFKGTVTPHGGSGQ